MKNLISFLAFMTIVLSLHADCGHGSFSVFPENGTIYKNSKIVITAHGMGGTYLFNKLDSTYSIYLKSGNQKIRLIKEEVIQSPGGNGQIVLRPESISSLKQGFVYSIQIDGLVGRDTFYKHHFKRNSRKNSCNEYEALDWLVLDKFDENAPISNNSPILIKKSYIPYGCGTSMGVHFGFDINDQSEILVMVEIYEVETNMTSNFILPIIENEVYVGSGMCYGEFNFKLKHNYKVRFKAYDICGNTDDNWTEWIKFETPFIENFKWKING